MNKSMRVLIWIAFTVAACTFVWLAVEIDVFAAGAPNDWIEIALISFPSLPAWTMVASLREVWALKAFGVLVAGVLLLSLFSWHPRHRFVDTLNSIEIGTSKAEALEAMKPHLDKSPWLGAPREKIYEKGSVLSFRWMETGWRYNADVGHVYLQDDKIVEVRFLPD